MKTKRCLQVKVSKESRALKAMREFRGKSVRKLAEWLGVSHALVHQMETGRGYVSSAYRGKFLKALGFTESDWELFLGGEQDYEELRDRCLQLLHEIKPEDIQEAFRRLTAIGRIQ